MRIGPFLYLIGAIIVLSAATVWLAQQSGVLALLPALSAVLLILAVLIRQVR